MKALPKFVDIFRKFNNISSQKGRSHFLLKRCGKYKWDEMEDDNRDKLKKANETISNLNKEVEQLEGQIKWFKEIEEKYIDNKGKLNKLYNYNVIYSDGELKS